jgi:mannose-6-phosphate isomerase-like protein (cupin superfamily)
LKEKEKMKPSFPSAEEYANESARFLAGVVVDVRSVAAGIADKYRNQVLVDVNGECLRLSVFEGEYRWHRHPGSDELFLVVAGELEIDFEGGEQVTLREWQCLVVPAGTVHRTRAVERTVNLTFERQRAETVFVGWDS